MTNYNPQNHYQPGPGQQPTQPPQNPNYQAYNSPGYQPPGQQQPATLVVNQTVNPMWRYAKIVLALVVLAVVSSMAFIAGFGTSVITDYPYEFEMEDPSIRNTLYEKGSSSSSPRIYVVPVRGVIMGDTAAQIHNAVDYIIDDEQAAAVVLRVESGGGAVTPSDQILAEFKRLKAERPNIKVVASFGSIAASGGYYIAMASDYIYAEDTTITGSIGVIAQVLTFKGTLDMLGIQPHVITAGTEKDTANNIFRDWTPKDYQRIQKMIDPMHETFISRVSDGRKNLSAEEVRSLANGDIWIADEAKEVGLVDDIGYLDAAIDKAATLRGISEPEVRVIEPARGVAIQFVEVNERGQNANANLQSIFQTLDADQVQRFMNDMGTPKPMYLYRP